MGIDAATAAFAGLPVEDFVPGQHPVLDAEHAWRLEIEDGKAGDDEDLIDSFLDTPGADTVRALVVGFWLLRSSGSPPDWSSDPPIDLLALASERLPALTALFLGDVVHAQYPISWVEQGPVHWLLREYPRLEILQTRGNHSLGLKPMRHECLRQLTLESGGLPADVVQGLGGCELPALEHLELWLGTPDYGGDSSVGDLVPVLSGERFPRLTTLALRNTEITDEICEALASAPVVARLDALDLSMGTLSDRGAEALLAGQPLTHLKRLDLRHHFLSDEMAARLVADLPGVDVDLARRQAPQRDEEGDAPESHRYIAVAE